MTQTMIEQLDGEEYTHFLSYGDPVFNELSSSNEAIMDEWAHELYDNDPQFAKETSWISTLDSTTYPDMTFGYFQAH